MIKLCYKKYNWKITNGACKSFFDKTGLDLHTVFGDYISAWIGLPESITLMDRMQLFSKIHSRDVASKALYSIISPCYTDFNIEEIEDATFRVSWVLSERPDDLSEPWPLVMLDAALQINDYLNANMPKKKEADT